MHDHMSAEMQACMDACHHCHVTCLSMTTQHCLQVGGAHKLHAVGPRVGRQVRGRSGGGGPVPDETGSGLLEISLNRAVLQSRLDFFRLRLHNK